MHDRDILQALFSSHIKEPAVTQNDGLSNRLRLFDNTCSASYHQFVPQMPTMYRKEAL